MPAREQPVVQFLFDVVEDGDMAPEYHFVETELPSGHGVSVGGWTKVTRGDKEYHALEVPDPRCVPPEDVVQDFLSKDPRTHNVGEQALRFFFESVRPT